MVKKNKMQKGGDGYVINVNEAIGGLPAFSRYSNNYRPIFDGELLQNGGNGYSIDPNIDIGGSPGVVAYKETETGLEDIQLSGGSKKNKNKKNKQKGGDGYSVDPNVHIDGMPVYKRYTYNDVPVFKGSLLNGGYKFLKIQSSGGGCGCDGAKKSETDIFELIKMNGGMKDNEKTQFYAIREIANLLVPLSTKSLLALNSKIFLNNLYEKKAKKYKQLGGYTNQIESILAPLGKNNLLVLASLLLLHYFAVESQKKQIKKSNVFKGGNPITSSLSEILAPLGVNALGTSILLILLQKSFVKTKEQKATGKNSKVLLGGNPLKNLIAPLGTNAFIATGLLILLERLFINKINEMKTKDKEKKVLIGGRANQKYEKLFNLLAPITFNIFAKESFLINYAKKNLKNNSKK